MSKMNMFRAAVFAGALAVPMSATTSAQPLVTGGLVNVTFDEIDVGGILNENTVQVSLGAALAIAANVCDVNVNVLARQLRDGGATCENAVDNRQATIQRIE